MLRVATLLALIIQSKVSPAVLRFSDIFQKMCSGSIDNRKKNLLNSSISSRCPHNMANFGPLTAEIGSVVWGTPANFNGFRVLPFVSAATSLIGGQPNFARCLAVSWAGTLYIRRYSLTKLCDGVQIAIFASFLRPAFSSEPRAAQTCILNSH